MAKKSGYDEKSKARTMRYNQKARENIGFNLPKGKNKFTRIMQQVKAKV